MPWCRLSAEVHEGMGDVRVVIDEAVVEVSETKERLDILDVVGCL